MGFYAEDYAEELYNELAEMNAAFCDQCMGYHSPGYCPDDEYEDDGEGPFDD